MKKTRLLSLTLVLFLFWIGEANAGQLNDRIATFPKWDNKPTVQVASGDLVYPEWMAGTWMVKSTLVDLVAPLAPEITTPGFEGNRRYLNQPVQFQVKFIKQNLLGQPLKLIPQPVKVKSAVVADRAFNGLSLARAYLGDRTVKAVKVDPDSPNRQITLLQGDRQLISIVTGRTTEVTAENGYVTTEVFGQQFRGNRARPYFNQVESTTAYHYVPNSTVKIVADQFTAVYLSAQDPDYFKAGDRPVALYRYRLEFSSQTDL
ncbi:DUF6816 family protein [Chroococcidiopsis sp.]|uniref:DUF6816 family protein n=1 Tax=Chroococcidiopsis sp. TaxID=3088168 RepID=UPI003F3FFE07